MAKSDMRYQTRDGERPGDRLKPVYGRKWESAVKRILKRSRRVISITSLYVGDIRASLPHSPPSTASPTPLSPPFAVSHT